MFANPDRQKKWAAKRKLALQLCVFLYVFLLAAYRGEPGGPQLGDVALASLFAVVTWWPRDALALAPPKPSRLPEVHRIFALATVWTLVVNAIAAAWTGQPSLLYATIPYVHAWLALALLGEVAGALGSQTLLRTLAYGALAALALAVVRAAVDDSQIKSRFGAGFADPNQLGYFAILAASIVCAAHHVLAVRVGPALVGCVAAGWLVVLSASRSALLGFVTLGVLTFVRAPLWTIIGGIAAALGSLVVEHTAWDALPTRSTEVTTNLLERQIQMRGYTRVVEHPGYLLFGAGEGAFERFLEDGLAIELHNSVGSWLFSYGAVGVVLLSIAVATLLRGFALTGGVLLAPAFVYGLGHQGLRFRALWLLVAAVALAADVALAQREQRSRL